MQHPPKFLNYYCCKCRATREHENENQSPHGPFQCQKCGVISRHPKPVKPSTHDACPKTILL